MTLILLCLAAYLIGSIPFGLLLTKWFGTQDIRTIGSGNIGATNVLRTGSKKLALATLLLDMGKGVVVMFLAYHLIDYIYHFPSDDHDNPIGFLMAFIAPPLMSVIAILGHMFPIWLHFKGGKGVATNIGVNIGYTLAFFSLLGGWLLAPLIPILVWLIIFVVTRISSLAGILSAISLPVFLLIYFGTVSMSQPAFFSSTLIALLVTIKHHANIRRLLKGEEHRFSFRK